MPIITFQSESIFFFFHSLECSLLLNRYVCIRVKILKSNFRKKKTNNFDRVECIKVDKSKDSSKITSIVMKEAIEFADFIIYSDVKRG